MYYTCTCVLVLLDIRTAIVLLSSWYILCALIGSRWGFNLSESSAVFVNLSFFFICNACYRQMYYVIDMYKICDTVLLTIVSWPHPLCIALIKELNNYHFLFSWTPLHTLMHNNYMCVHNCVFHCYMCVGHSCDLWQLLYSMYILAYCNYGNTNGFTLAK